MNQGTQLAMRLREGPIRKTLLVGEMNPWGADPDMALYPLPEHASGGRLARILGLSRTEYLRTFERRNLCVGKWSMPAARKAAERILREVDAWGSVIMLGAKVSAAFGCAKFVPFSESAVEFVTGDVRLFSLPHPSGLNRLWNQPGAQERARLTVMKAIWGDAA